ncbi:MAG: hypothetical protein HY617_01320 [Candidatus Sungbacteria bacterium]|nr:hypothetical protein [Candidatus Sungbacteria bacterium]
MKNLQYLVPQGHTFTIDEERPFLITTEDLAHISRIGRLVHTLLEHTMYGLGESSHWVSSILFNGLDMYYEELGIAHPRISPTLIRVDLMVDVQGNWKIAEIDPSNKHGIGFALATCYESQAKEWQRLLSLIAAYVTEDVTIVLGRKEVFFRFEQRYFAKMLAKYTGKNVMVISEDQLTKKLEDGLILDFPFCYNPESRELLGRRFFRQPEDFINPPRHMLGGKALMTLPYEYASWLESAGMSKTQIEELKTYLPPTYLGPFIGKEVFSSGAKGVFFDAVGKNTVFQKYIPQRAFLLDGAEKFIRMACFFVQDQLGELIVSANTELPVHGGNTAVHYHVEVQ